jgi:hypothetical protein
MQQRSTKYECEYISGLSVCGWLGDLYTCVYLDLCHMTVLYICSSGSLAIIGGWYMHSTSPMHPFPPCMVLCCLSFGRLLFWSECKIVGTLEPGGTLLEMVRRCSMTGLSLHIVLLFTWIGWVRNCWVWGVNIYACHVCSLNYPQCGVDNTRQVCLWLLRVPHCCFSS